MPNYIPQTLAAAKLAVANRVLVVGTSGGGKTTLSLEISRVFGLDYISLDRDTRWLPGWKQRPRAEQRALIAALVARDRWVMDGSGASTFDLRLPRADLVLWLRVPRRVALAGVLGRVARSHGRVRVAMPEGCPEKFPDREFLSYIWTFEAKHAPAFERNMDRFGSTVPVVCLRSRREAREMIRIATSHLGAP